MDERHAAETAALEQRERDAAGPQEETTDILATDLYSFSLPPSETQKQVWEWFTCFCQPASLIMCVRDT